MYLGLSGDFLHHGHINILTRAREYGDVTVGLLTDQAIAFRKKIPVLTYEQRREVVSNLAGVVAVVPQDEWDYTKNVLNLKPDFFIHGDDWAQGPELKVRDRVISALDTYGGKLIEVPYTTGVSSGALATSMLSVGATPEVRRASLRRILDSKPLSRFIEAHSPLSALIAEKSVVIVDGVERRFDGFWSSSLTDSTNLGKPDTEVVSVDRRLEGVSQIFEITSNPLIFDADTGGQAEHLALHVKTMERLGISALIIEDKRGLKKNSLLGNEVLQFQEPPEIFAQKIEAAVRAKSSPDFMVIARIESLILEAGMEDAINRAVAYVEAGADAIMIHSRKKTPDEIFTFAREFRSLGYLVPLVCVPTTYNQTHELELQNHGFNIVIYANHLLRAAYPAMKSVAEKILSDGNSSAADQSLVSIDEILSLIPGTI